MILLSKFRPIAYCDRFFRYTRPAGIARNPAHNSLLIIDTKSEKDGAEPVGLVQAFDSSSENDQELPPLTKTTERKLMAKIDWHILPCLCVLYLLAFLDRYGRYASQP